MERWRSDDDERREFERAWSGTVSPRWVDEREGGDRVRGDAADWPGHEERSFLQRAGDEIRSWFGDEDAQRRRALDDLRRQREEDRGTDAWSEPAADDPWDEAPGPHRARWARPDRDDPGFGREPHWGAIGSWGPSWRYSEIWVARRRASPTYHRVDERVWEDVCDLLTEHGDVDASDVEVSVRAGEVTLTGTVDSRPTKRLIEDLAESVPGVREVHNQLRVRAPRGAESDTRM